MRKSKGCLYWIFIGWWYEPFRLMEKFLIKFFVYAIILGVFLIFAFYALPIVALFFALIIILKFIFRKIRKYGNIDFDTMNGHQFENFCSDILKDNGFYNVKVTKGSGDHGIDILANKGWKKYAIQCKCYSNNVGNKAIQEAYAGKTIYKADSAVVLTNSYFTKQAKEEATQLGVELWDRDKLLKFVNNHKNSFLKKDKKKNLQNNMVIEEVNKKEEVLTIEDIKYSHVNNYVEKSEKDDLFADAGRFIIEQGEVSTERLQRKFKIGFNRALRIIEQLKAYGIIRYIDFENKTEILMTMEEFENFLIGNKNDIGMQKSSNNMSKKQLEEYMELCREEYELKRKLDFLKKQQDEYIIVKNSSEEIREVALEIYKTFLVYGVEIKFTNIELEIGNVVYKFVPLGAVRVKTILSYKPEISLALGSEVEMKLLAEKGCIGVFVPHDYIIRKRNENEKEKTYNVEN